MFRRFLTTRLGLGLADDEMSRLTQANGLLANGHFGDAAQLYAQLAAELEGDRHPRRAANLHAQAAYAYIDSKDEAHALNQARTALNLFLQYRMIHRIPRFYTNFVRKLHSQGMTAAASQLENEFSTGVRAVPDPVQAIPSSKRGQLPTACPHCGAPVRSDEVDWIDERSAECLFCGGALTALG